jgi:hypothetical protein
VGLGHVSQEGRGSEVSKPPQAGKQTSQRPCRPVSRSTRSLSSWTKTPPSSSLGDDARVLDQVGQLAGALAEHGADAGVDGVAGDDVDDLGAAGGLDVALGAVLGLQRLHQRPGPLQEDERAGGARG